MIKTKLQAPLKRLLPKTLALLVAGLLGACASTTPQQDLTPGSARNALPRNWSPVPNADAGLSAAQPKVVADAADIAHPLLEDSLQPGVAIDLNEARASADLWVRLRNGFAMPELDNNGVRRAEIWYSSRPDYVQRMTDRGGRYLFHVIEEVEKRGMPTELALLPFVESAFNPQAMSNAKASGMWQFVPATGRDFALKQNIFRDDRRDVLASTRAALDYLGRLHKMFGGDWQLALAAYNWGQGNVQKAITRNQKAGLPTDYDNLKMPDETRYYLPKLQAVKNIVLAPQKFGLSLPAMSNHPYFLSVILDRDIDVDLAARLAGMKVDEFKQFNPQMNKPVMLAAGTNQMLLPYDNAKAFAEGLAAHSGPLASWTAWTVTQTMSPAAAAKQIGMNEALLREINMIPPRMLVKQGSTLLVPRAAHRIEDVSEHMAENASINLAPDTPALRRVSYKAGKAETVESMASRYRVSPAQVAEWNKVGVKASFNPGQSVVMYTPFASKRVAMAKPNAAVKPANAAKAPSPGKVGNKPMGGRTVAAKFNGGILPSGLAARQMSKK
ncbi:transglycosylase SLT domain-containing protein [Roseateles oligotrophus]|uniref:Transglycosylase SLT domain-containing protein n=1 Tax=Roseateles oligotrophus TaxID=1769250 RepID=A0ABT2YL98_9BURK|nr:transglycosylase SLT domain-containing protein [Roseateles oligotrophus]MCV2370833.1 transglycosylase SLT domain-containing protein [Roseateles oligotrophus]